MPHLPDFEAWAIFAKVAEKGSFIQAAEDLGLAKTTVSKTITRLEERMRTTLLHRTTRKLSLTETGRLSLERALRILADGAAIESDILEEAAIPRGLVRMACTTGFGGKSLAPVLPKFMKLYPDIEIDLCLTEDQVDVVADGYDVAIRIGQGADSSLRTSRLFSFRRPLVAAPEFIERFGLPEHPSDLIRFPAIIPTHVPWGSEWEFAREGDAPIAVHMKGAFRVNSVAAIVPAAIEGLGLALMPEYFLWEELNSGALVELLPDWAAPPGPVYLVTPPGRARPARVRVLLDFLREHFATQPWANGIER
ncbi:LysR family transcriptional regulator [Sphingomonas sp. RB3P16]|uniref:LysR family transcriptional regulator n=1 Tax=Parasphingomonas frigoris TaxID=3096163 RepID=UPI002FC7297D